MRSRRRRVSAQREENSSSAQLMSLSLFIMLLAFFIVLNALSSFEETRVKPIMESIESSFASRVLEKDDLRPSVTKSAEYSIYEGNTLERLEALFHALIPDSKIVRNKQTGEMHVRLSWADFKEAVLQMDDPSRLEQDLTIEGRKDDGQGAISFLPVLVSLMHLDQAGLTYRMDMVLNVKKNPATIQTQNPQDFLRFVHETADVSNKLEASGLSQHVMSIGLQKGEMGLVDIFFRPHIPFDPRGTMEENVVPGEGDVITIENEGNAQENGFSEGLVE